MAANYPTSLPPSDLQAAGKVHGEGWDEVYALASDMGLPATGGAAYQRPHARVGAYYYVPGASTGEQVPLEGTLYATPFPLPRAMTIDRIGLYISTQGGAGEVIRLGIYEDSAGLPGTLVLDAGTVSATTTGLKEVTVSQSLLISKRYWLAYATQGASGTVARPRAAAGPGFPIPTTAWTGASVGSLRGSSGSHTGAFPGTFPGSPVEVVDCPWFGVRVSA